MGRPAAEPEQARCVIKYTTNLQIVHKFKDPRTVDQTEGAVQAQWCSSNIMNAQIQTKHKQDRSKTGENHLAK